MAELHLATASGPEGFAKTVVIKRLLPHLVSDRRIVQMFLNEARITAQVHPPNVVSILELGVEDTEPFIAMELLEGHSFAELRQTAAQSGKRVPLGVTLRILTEACRGLDAAHRAVDSKGRELRDRVGEIAGERRNIETLGAPQFRFGGRGFVRGRPKRFPCLLL